ncbi:MAG: FtsW/RodA/SpoVE family cell cycle protein, partial [Candidatus Saccharibacteria bacterium]|nr:FtsW/RodA/SpoVE family cell cycle protein [Candidatus Saccharibacteria bacterium]
GILLAGVAFIVAGLQSDLGSAAVMMAIIGVSAFVSGLPMKRLLSVGLVVLVIGLVAVVSTPYRRDRVATFLNPTADCQAEGYQACQALITIGSGGLFGKGLGRSVQAYGYLPYPENDSIFAIVGEKFGFVGSVTVIAVFWTLFRRIANIARSAPDDYSRLLVTGVLVWLSTQTIINVGAMVGLLPLKGITLPFISYGGTSIIFVMIAMGIVFNVSRYTDLSAVKHKESLGRDSMRPVRYSRRVS